MAISIGYRYEREVQIIVHVSADKFCSGSGCRVPLLPGVSRETSDGRGAAAVRGRLSVRLHVGRYWGGTYHSLPQLSQAGAGLGMQLERTESAVINIS